MVAVVLCAALPAWSQDPVSAGRCWGLCCRRYLLNRNGHIWVPALADGTRLPVERLHSYKHLDPDADPIPPQLRREFWAMNNTVSELADGSLCAQWCASVSMTSARILVPAARSAGAAYSASL